MVFSYSPNAPSLSRDIFLGQDQIEMVSEHKYLGVTFDRRFSFVSHFTVKCSKAKSAIGALCHEYRSYAPSYVLNRIYTMCILPSLLYGQEVCWPRPIVIREKIERVNCFMARQIKNDFISPYSNLLEVLKWKPLWRCNIEKCLLLFYKYYYELHYFPREFLPKPNAITTRYSTRINSMVDKHDCMVDINCKKVTSGSLFIFRIAKIWNVLPNNVVSLSYNRFKAYIESDHFIELLREKSLSPEVIII